MTLAGVVGSAGATLGYDFHAYGDAAARVLHGERLYDPAVDVAGGFAIYLYPPPFALAIVPLALIGGQAAVWVWTTLLVAAFVAGVALLPVRSNVRWVVLALGAIDWPLLYSVKLGQVGPILFLLLALGWRAIDRPAALGTTIGLGAIMKVQPILLAGWAILTGRWSAALIGLAVVGAAALVSVIVAGIQPWIDYPALLARVASPLTTPHNFTPGAVAYQAGLPSAVASAVQVTTSILAILAVLVATRVARADASYLVAVVASQLLSPLLWDHYAMLLLLPVAWLLERRQWWAVAIPIATSIGLVGIAPSLVYPTVFGVSLVAPIVAGRSAKSRVAEARG